MNFETDRIYLETKMYFVFFCLNFLLLYDANNNNNNNNRDLTKNRRLLLSSNIGSQNMFKYMFFFFVLLYTSKSELLGSFEGLWDRGQGLEKGFL